METASFNGIIRTIIYVIVFWYVFKFLIRIFFPILVKKAVNHAEQNFRQQYGQGRNDQQYNNHNSKGEPEIIVDTTTAPKSRVTKKVGEYVDYEEIE